MARNQRAKIEGPDGEMENTSINLSKGQLRRIEYYLHRGEGSSRTDFIRQALMWYLDKLRNEEYIIDKQKKELEEYYNSRVIVKLDDYHWEGGDL